MTQEEWDVRTMRAWLQPIAAVFLGLIILYFLAGFHMVFRKQGVPKWTALSYWSMFSVGSWGNSELESEAMFDGKWKSIDMAELFPTQWESGYRWTRMKRSAARMSVVAAATCKRHPDKPQRIKYTVVSWTKVLGSLERKKVMRKQVVDFDCKRRVRLPGGRVLGGGQ